MLDQDLVALAFETRDDCIKMLATDGTLLLLNAGGAAAMGLEGPDDPVGRNWVEFWEGEDREAARVTLAAAANGRATTLRGYLPTVTGLPRWWESTVTPLPGAHDEPARVLVISRDVTARREAEWAKKRSERLHRTLVEATFVIVWSRDLGSGRCESRGWTEFTGYSHEPSDVASSRAPVRQECAQQRRGGSFQSI